MTCDQVGHSSVLWLCHPCGAIPIYWTLPPRPHQPRGVMFSFPHRSGICCCGGVSARDGMHRLRTRTRQEATVRRKILLGSLLLLNAGGPTTEDPHGWQSQSTDGDRRRSKCCSS